MKYRLQLAVLVAAIALAACQFQPDYTGTSYSCPDGDCPDGFRCVAERCEVIGSADAAVADAAIDAGADAHIDAGAEPDAELGICELAALEPDNDGCGDAIVVAGGAIVYGDTSGYANQHNPPGLACTGQPTAGSDAVYAVVLAVGETITATMTPHQWDGALYLSADDCAAVATCLDGHDSVANGVAETVEHTALAAQTYYLIVDGATLTSAQSGCFTLEVTVE